ncbi:alpha/beta fold hydrolase [Sneathiella sp. P13V-1]|uniref:alpha/beta fold hydrolase n=1 Tax=Sneathiella sp. P13V-1 TaxID=2697366 RepID=UPI00187B7B45|nr:alpha/beta fold hydrolase [Sneathiella sp. P13V-1]MBE7635697.1 alpha/beta fold hydrolase [Sneathiella sp. P13V-1]
MSEKTSQSVAEIPPVRIGPRPMGLHLGLGSLTVTSSVAALPLAQIGNFPWLPELEEEADALSAKLQQFTLPELMLAVGKMGQSRLSGMLTGIQKYHRHPYRRKISDHKIIWKQQGCCLQEFADKKLSLGAPLVFLVPSLVNRSYILDLKENRSFAAFLQSKGFRAVLLDWGVPEGDVASFSLADYFNNILFPAFEFLKSAYPESPKHLLGYCMGGTMSVAVAERYQSDLTSFMAVAAPWDFHAGLGEVGKTMFSATQQWQQVIATFGNLPVDILQTFFTALDPNLCMKKFNMFNQMDMSSERAEDFVALEDWLNDGVPLAGKVAMECLGSWYGDNAPHKGEWILGDNPVCPQNITIPSMIAVPKSDKIVPPQSALSLAEQLENATIVTPPSGHVGMMAGARACSGLWSNVTEWIESY